ncbi:MAG: malonyl-CoA decarboxylase, partial [Pseudomonadota bacterium]
MATDPPSPKSPAIGRSSAFTDLLTSVFDRPILRFRSADPRDITELCAELMQTKGETATLERSATILDAYEHLDQDEQITFFGDLTDAYDIDADEVVAAATQYAKTGTPEDLARLTRLAEPRRQDLFRRLNRVSGATARLVRMRADLLPLMRETPRFGRIDLDLQHLFASWFNRGFLVLRRINWQTPANILEKIILYESVHAINDWDDLRRRVEPSDRRCFAYFHPCMPDDPLIFVEVALTHGTPNTIASVLAEERDTLAETDIDRAVFYSISNCQKGLAGISFGNALIKQVVAELAAEMPQLKTFVTLSPIPGFAKWLAATHPDLAAQIAEADVLDPFDQPITALAATYLAQEKTGDGRPKDPVARFHLANGAALQAVHPRADLSENGRAQSAGAMVNYIYEL